MDFFFRMLILKGRARPLKKALDHLWQIIKTEDMICFVAQKISDFLQFYQKRVHNYSPTITRTFIITLMLIAQKNALK